MDIVWRNLSPQKHTLEHLILTPWHQVKSTIVGVMDQQSYTLTYTLNISEDAHPSRLELEISNLQRSLMIERDRAGNWHDRQGQVITSLNNCTDVDISATPFTNTLPIRRLNLKIGKNKEIRVAWIAIPSLELRTSNQRYTRLSKNRYQYENLESGYVNSIFVDDDGLVMLYPNLFERML